MYLVRQFTLMVVPTIDKYHSVMNISQRFLVLIDLRHEKKFTYVHHCNNVYTLGPA